MTGLLPYLLTAVLYAALGAYFWRTRWHAEGSRAHATGQPAMWEKFAALAPLVMHTLLLQQSLFSGGGINLGVGNALSAIIWLTVLIYWLANFRYPLEGLQTPILAIATVVVMLPVLMPESYHLPNTEPTALLAHVLVAILAYSLFTIAALHASLMAVFERRLHGGGLSTGGLTQFPPLLTMEKLLFNILWAGFVLLTLALGSGILFSEQLFGQPLKFSHFTSHKTVFAILSWLIYGTLLGGRLIYGWRGRTAIRWTIAGFAMLFLAYIGSKFVLEIILHR
jgi:ABC-type uncharacterized transport system permease subunit